MPKRTLVTVATSPSKKVKVAADQHSLDRYFGGQSPTSRGRTATGGARKNENKLSPQSSGSGFAISGREESVQDGPLTGGYMGCDESLAWAVAKGDGLDLEGLRKLETAAKLRSSSRSRATTKEPVEVIDVDLLDEFIQTPKAGPSRPAGSASRSSNPPRTTYDNPIYQSVSVDPVFYVVSDLSTTGSPIPYSFLAHTLSSLSGTRSRITIINILTNALRTITGQHPPSLLPALYLLSNSLSPPYSPIELGLGPSIISKAVQHVSGLTSTALRRLYNSTGDPGDVAYEAKSNVRTLIPHPPLHVPDVYDALLQIALARGQGAANQKQKIVEKLLVAAKGEEIRFLVRTLSQNLRVGAVRTSLLTALSRAMVLTPPGTITVPIPSDSRFFVSPKHLAQIQPVSQQPSKKVLDPARDALNTIFTNAEALLKRVYVQHPNYDDITKALLEGGLDHLAESSPLTVGIPLLPTLGSPTRSLDEIYDRLGLLSFSAEFKYDGQRAQIHASRDNSQQPAVKVFSRHLEDMTDKYPDIVSLVTDIFAISPRTTSFIIDAEIVAIDPADGSIKSFQELSNRARKDVRSEDIKITVCVFVFDLMYLDGQVLLEKPFRERRALLRSHFPPYTSKRKEVARLDHVRSCESEGGREAIEDFWRTALSSQCEGLMIKASDVLLDSGDVLEDVDQKGKSRHKPLPATYEPDRRTSAWLKLKKDYVIGLGDSLDLVPIGAWHGNGRKAQWWSPILLAVWDPVDGKLVAMCKCMSGKRVVFSCALYDSSGQHAGFSDSFYKSLKERYPEDSDTCSPQPLWDPVCETGGLKPEVYFKPQEVWEIRGADVTVSPVSIAALGLVSQTRGLSLRFPRFMKVREDKKIDDASTPDFLANMWRTQQSAGKDQRGADDGELVEVEISQGEVSENESEE
ncbi:uncharacterized protein FIBRA_03532 [Fibroporia radiculosa]|uniref:DNA ligase n=1 Tax=Fibroporia radiculosa TaxID=599839 RepID=J4G5S6_9APHY|nr:uncharacterized protein FIBRA_03532 [Fibroporia radiculosa]CCM01478.1 predicted protein [Fibroporia radiculosa]